MAASELEKLLALTPVPGSPDVFASHQHLWHPPGGRGVFGGVVVSQCLSAAKHTVGRQFIVHSVHCSFLSPGKEAVPIQYSVQKVRDGKSFVTRTIVASQKGHPIMTGNLSFMREGSGGARPVHHSSTMADGLQPPQRLPDLQSHSKYAPLTEAANTTSEAGPPQDKLFRLWFRTPTAVCQKAGSDIHQILLAFMSDWNLLPGVPLAQGLWKFPDAVLGNGQMSPLDGTEVGIMASLDHSIYFHKPLDIRADEWMMMEINSPWAGCGRGLATSKIFDMRGSLLATCFQEGYVRMRDEGKEKISKF